MCRILHGPTLDMTEGVGMPTEFLQPSAAPAPCCPNQYRCRRCSGAPITPPGTHAAPNLVSGDTRDRPTWGTQTSSWAKMTNGAATAPTKIPCQKKCIAMWRPSFASRWILSQHEREEGWVGVTSQIFQLPSVESNALTPTHPPLPNLTLSLYHKNILHLLRMR